MNSMGVPFLTRERCQKHRWLGRIVIVVGLITLIIITPVALCQQAWPWLKRLPRDAWDEVLYPLYEQLRDAVIQFGKAWK